MMADSAVTSPRSGYPSRGTPYYEHVGNIAYICGDGNDTIQTGRANDCWTKGDGNQTHQFGVGNRGRIYGKYNATMQRVPED